MSRERILFHRRPPYHGCSLGSPARQSVLVRWRAALATSAAALTQVAPPALAASGSDLVPAIDLRGAFGSALVAGLVIFAATLAILSVRERRRWSERERGLAAELDRLRGAQDRAELLLGASRQVVVAWSGAASDPVLEGDPSIAGEAASYRRVLAFGSWLLPPDAARLEGALTLLRERGEAFRTTLATSHGSFVEAEGRTAAGRALLRLVDVSSDQAAALAAEDRAVQASDQAALLRSLLDQIEEPVWLRERTGALTWANRAYCRAVDAPDIGAVAERSLELLERGDRVRARSALAAGEMFQSTVPAIVAGTRRDLRITEMPLPAEPGCREPGSRAGGIARDVSEIQALRERLDQIVAAQVRMLDQLPLAVAMFDSGQRILFHNAAYRHLWNLDAAFLETRPSDGEILDHLRVARRLPEQADFRAWKTSLLDGYRSTEPTEAWWHLPDRRTLRVVVNPNPEGGVTYLFDDISDRMDLESRVNALTATQRETLDALAEGVALFGTDGRLKLFNFAFAELWRIGRVALETAPHIDAVVEIGRRLAPDDGPWSDLRSAVAGLTDMRERIAVRMERADGSVVDAAAEPLPDGATLLTFVDVTATVNVERALTDRNDALELAARLRNEFVHHVSYELRSPLTTIIGFAELLGAETVGPLNERQREYAGHITRSSGSLLAIINDILDLASIDTDTIALVREPVDVLGAIEAAATGIEDRIVEAKLRLEIDVPSRIGSFMGDARRVRQVVYNLLSNAAAFSSAGQTIRVAARKQENAVIISVSDQGSGIPPEMRDRVFDRFESHADGKGHRGVGLGLSIVRAFVELHGGHVELVSEAGSGTTVTCFFPTDLPPGQQLAASVPPDDGP